MTSTAIPSSAYQLAPVPSKAAMQHPYHSFRHETVVHTITYSEGSNDLARTSSNSLMKHSASPTTSTARVPHYGQTTTMTHTASGSKLASSLPEISSSLKQQRFQTSKVAITVTATTIEAKTTTTTTTTTWPNTDKERTEETSNMVASILGLTLGLSIGIPVGALFLLIGGTYLYFVKVEMKKMQVHPIFKN